MWGPMDLNGMGWGWFGLVHLLWWVAVIGAGVLLLRWVIRAGGGRSTDDRGRAEAILRERYARGEIEKAEFDERMEHLRA